MFLCYKSHLLYRNTQNKHCNRLCYFCDFTAIQRRVIAKAMEPINIDRGRVAQKKISKLEIILNLLLFGVQKKKKRFYESGVTITTEKVLSNCIGN